MPALTTIISFGPLMGALATLGLAVWLGQPVTYAIVGAALVFGGIAQGMLRASEWRENSRVWGKLQFSDVVWRCDLERDDQGEPVINSVQYSLALTNTASFPIHFRVERMNAVFAGEEVSGIMLDEGAVMPGKVFIVPGPLVLLGTPLAMDVNARTTGEFVFAITYGRWKGRRFNTIAHRLRPVLTRHIGENFSDSWAYAEDRSVIEPRDW